MNYHGNHPPPDYASNHPFTDAYGFELQNPMLSNSEKVTSGGTFNNHQMADGMSKPKKGPTWRQVGYEFTQSTTLHGVNKITEPTSFTTRRLIWTMVVMAGLGLFVYQLVASLFIYFQYPVTVNIKINYNNSVVFPAVTICNQNAYRLTRADDLGYYQGLFELYVKKDGLAGHIQNPLIRNKTLLDIYESMSHDIADMIVNCSWYKTPCSAQNFTKKITNHGTCFTFNLGQTSPVLQATRTGVGTGLSLRLNVEQYEYMPGPNNGAGIKILVHDQDDAALIREMAQAVPPGAKGLVGITIIKMLNLEQPYGKCEKNVELEIFDRYTYSTCQLDCEHRYLVSTCGCRMHYMPETTPGYPLVCTLEQFATCGSRALDELREASDQLCICPVPCVRSMFESLISYAQIAKFDTDEVLFNQDASILQQRYITARETAHRVDQQIRDRDTQLVNILNNSSATIENIILKVKDKVDDLISQMNLLAQGNDIRRRQHEVIVSKVVEMMEKGFLQQIDVVKATLTDYRSKYANVMRDAQQVTNRTQDLTMSRSEIILEMRLDIGGQLRHVSRDTQKLMTYTEELLDCFQNFKILLYRPIFENFFNEETRIFIIPELEDMFIPRKVIEIHWPPLKRALEDFKSKLDQIQVTFQTHNSAEIYEQLYDLTRSNYEMASLLLDSCFISLDQLRLNLNLFQNSCRNTMETIQQMSNMQIELLAMQSSKVNTTLKLISPLIIQAGSHWSHIKTLINISISYLENSGVSKGDLANHASSLDYQRALTGMQDFFVQFTSSGKELESVSGQLTRTFDTFMATAGNDILTGDIYDAIKAFKMEYSDNETALDRLADAFLRSSSDSSDMEDLRAFMVDTENNSRIVEVYRQLGLQLDDLRTDLQLDHVTGGQWSKFFTHLDKWTFQLKEFVEGHALNLEFFRQNFLDVEVYMKELYYEEIEQQIGYDLVNLWSDIGGSLGLCVGASLMTVVEIIDAVLHNLAKRRLASVKS